MKRSCRVCKSDLKMTELKDNRFLLNGPFLICSKCGILYFSEPGFISPEGKITLLSTYFLELEGKQSTAIATPPESTSVVIKADLDQANDIETITIAVGFDRLDDKSSRIVCDVVELVKSARCRKDQQLFRLQFMGLLNDSRPIWNIPEIAMWFADTWVRMPDLMFHIPTNDVLDLSRAVCLSFSEDFINQCLQTNPELNIDKIIQESTDEMGEVLLEAAKINKLDIEDVSTRAAVQRLLIFQFFLYSAFYGWIDGLTEAERSYLEPWSTEVTGLFGHLFLDLLPYLPGKKKRWWKLWRS